MDMGEWIWMKEDEDEEWQGKGWMDRLLIF
jgi:hypothetical protein